MSKEYEESEIMEDEDRGIELQDAGHHCRPFLEDVYPADPEEMQTPSTTEIKTRKPEIKPPGQGF